MILLIFEYTHKKYAESHVKYILIVLSFVNAIWIAFNTELKSDTNTFNVENPQVISIADEKKYVFSQSSIIKYITY